ncbi:hypothetical protein [Metabacillus sp. SLBN-84]
MEALDVLILGISKYSFNDDSGRLVEGTTVHYVQTPGVNGADKKGLLPAKATLPVEAFEGMFSGAAFPCKAKAGITLDLSNKRNPIKVTGFHIKEAVKL